jgi:putative membrane protein
MVNIGTIIGIILIVLVLVLLMSGAGMMGFGGYGMGPGMMGGFGMHGFGNQFGFGFNPLGWILSFVFWALIIAGIVLLVVWLARNVGRTTFGTPVGESPLDILRARYAKGELTKQQYEEMRRDLTQ